jgi:uncharacterized RDD family membrane protein YckC
VTGEIMPAMRADPDVASIPRRAVAGTIDGVLWILVFVGGGVAVAWRRGSSGEWSMPQGRTVKAFGWALRATALLLRNRRTPGQRLLGIRRIDARTGRSVSLWAAIVRQAFDLGYQRLLRPATRRATSQQMARSAEARRRIEELRAARAGDIARIQEETIAIQRETGVSCGPTLLKGVAIGSLVPLTALRSPRRQTIADRASGTVIVRERRR